MLSYLKCLFCLSAVAFTHSIDIQSKYLDLNTSPEYYKYQVVYGNNDRAVVQVYYESLCPDCKVFHTGALDDTYRKIESYIDLKTYPYGNAESSDDNGKTVITCQHGPAECYGNKLHACAIDILKNVSASEFYNSCMMLGKWGGKGSTTLDAKKCGTMLNIDSKSIIECAQGERGEELLEYYGKETDKLSNRTFVPWVLINGRFFDTDKENLMKRICDVLSNPPAPCGN